MPRSRRDHPLAGVPGSDIYKAERSPDRLRGVPGSAPIFKPTVAERASAAVARLASRWTELRDSLVEEFRQASGQPPPPPAARAADEIRPAGGGRQIAAASARPGPAAGPGAYPARRLAIVTCMDPRVDVLRALNLSAGDAHVLRNAGGIVTDDIIRSLAVSQHLMQTREVILVAHTDCDMQRVDDAQLRTPTGIAAPFAGGAVEDVDAELRRSIQRVQRSPLLVNRDRVRGYVYDVDSHRLREVRPGFDQRS